MNLKAKRVILSIVFLVLGFMIAFSYNLTSKKENHEMVNEEWNAEYQLREQYIEQEKQNRDLQQQIFNLQEKIANMEKNIAQEENVLADLAKEAEQYRMYLGKVKVQGAGVEVTLSDGEYDNANYNINEYLVHEHHVFNVINELLISGAEAVAVNGQRLKHDSYILCNGPVITIDGEQHPAPFVITAIGKQAVLEGALLMTGGIRDQLVNENVIFALEKKDKIVMEPIMGS